MHLSLRGIAERACSNPKGFYLLVDSFMLQQSSIQRILEFIPQEKIESIKMHSGYVVGEIRLKNSAEIKAVYSKDTRFLDGYAISAFGGNFTDEILDFLSVSCFAKRNAPPRYSQLESVPQ